MRKAIAVALILIGIGLAGAIYSFSWDELLSFGTKPVSQEKTVDAAGVSSLTVEAGSMDIEVVPGSSDKIVVHLEGRASSKYLNKLKLETEQDGDRLVIKSSFNTGFTIGINYSSFKLTVELPERQWDEVTLKANSGNVSASDMNSRTLAMLTSSGRVKGEDLSADEMDFETTSGKIELLGVTGESMKLDVSSGSIKIEDYKAETVEFNTTSGNASFINGTGELYGQASSGKIRVESETITHSMKLDVTSGNIVVEAKQPPQSAEIKLKTTSGSQKVEWDNVQTEKEDDRSFAGTIGTGSDLSIDLKTSSGNITLK
ncbi:DUF4097 family beta strand repeat-containing protein [Paenibacillus sp. Leaf72]|uniref:DUF4097 family beta strand repeat-containing protein n=1 Tax=Paenibacillus sp. Leaf72 TaxID=1736234 RepID=UPI0006F78639|nr:DUF4097 family beta strand repeat-containing protein [Paenibacillus sp. Leaf72]KQO01042.1 hypothetical protein ASF12_14380 [Paenibacillus sp. Leaf72]